MRELTEQEAAFLQAHRVARLATVDERGQPYVVPICYVFDGQVIFSALDEKPKQVAPTRLKRVRNLLVNPRVGLVVDDYDEDWSRLAYEQIRGQAARIQPGTTEHTAAIGLLRAKYPQYQTMAIEQQPVVQITPEQVSVWRGL
jgi:PPOX class probable F420-dependent enzyme